MVECCVWAVGSQTYQLTQSLDTVAKSLNLGRDDLYIVVDLPQLQYELEVCICIDICTVVHIFGSTIVSTNSYRFP